MLFLVPRYIGLIQFYLKKMHWAVGHKKHLYCQNEVL